MIDAHLHLPPSGDGGMEFYAEAGEFWVGRWALNSTTEADWRTVLALASTRPEVTPLLGIHPWWAASVEEGWLARLALALSTSRAGIGEIGLDALTPLSAACQERVFLPQLELAEELGVAVTIHCCRRWGRLLELLSATLGGRAQVIIHGFSGSPEVMHRLLDLGALLSFGPSLAAPAREKVRESFRKTPLDRLLLESDWPPRRLTTRGQTPVNTPPGPATTLAALYLLAAKLKAMSETELRTQVWKNGQVLTH